MKAIRIIERLLTQSKYHEQHVLYRDYPPVDIAKNVADQDEEANENDKNRMMPFGGADKKKKEEEKKEEDLEINDNEDQNKVDLTHLFKFRCDLTDGRQGRCIDINSTNKDLIACAYGEYDIIHTTQLK